MRTLFKNAHLVSPGVDLPSAALLIEGNIIKAVYQTGSPNVRAERFFDVKGNYLLPGFIDIHVHGCCGHDFCDASDESIRAIVSGKLAEGVTSLLATTMTAEKETILEVLSTVSRHVAGSRTGARLLGAHLEGPFLNPEGAGAQNPEFLCAPSAEFVFAAHEIFPLKKLSLAPELSGAIELIRQLTAWGIMPSGAHSTADFQQFEEARQAGMKHLTHFCNIMTPLHHLRPGMVGGGLLADDVWVEIIADGVHLSREMLQIIFRCKGPERVMLITDAMRAAGMPDGAYSLGGLPVTVKKGRATIANGMVAGSVCRYFEGLQYLRSLQMLPDAELIRCAGFNQAVSLKIPGLGALKTGYFADFVIADAKWEPLEVWKDGIRSFIRETVRT